MTVSKTLVNMDMDYYAERNKASAKDVSGLTFEESKALKELENIIGEIAEVSVMNPKAEENGRKISVMGFMATSVFGEQVFAVGIDFLQRMAADPEYKEKMLEDARRMADEQRSIDSLSSAPRQSVTVPQFPMYQDFWNASEDKNDFGDFYKQARQKVISKYERYFNYQ